MKKNRKVKKVLWKKLVLSGIFLLFLSCGSFLISNFVYYFYDSHFKENKIGTIQIPVEEKPVKVSVIIPVYNVEPYLKKCIQSLLEQTLKDVEFIFVDDCSLDNSSDIIKSHADPRIKLIRHNVNKYTAEARNTGIANARGEYIAFVDPDDYIDKNFLLNLYTLAKRNNADIAKGVYKKSTKNKIFNNNDKVKKNKYLFSGAFWTALYKKELFEKYHIKFHVDCMVGQFLLVHFAQKIVTTDTAVYNYVIREGSVSHNKFTPEKWEKLSIRGGDLMFEFANKLNIEPEGYAIVLKNILFIYQFGYYRMSIENQQKYKDKLRNRLINLYSNAKFKNNMFISRYMKALQKLKQ